MSELTIYNTLTRGKAPLRPIEPGKVRMYVCGMTVYDYCHLGHARVLVAFDVVTRWLRERGFDVTYVRNITDIDDKILRRAAENGEPYTALTERFIAAMHEDEQRLGVLRPDLEPRATDHIVQIIAMIERLIETGHAYCAHNGDVYYAVASFATYGQLSGKNPDELLAGARIEVDEAKRDPRDFALWKSAKADEAAVWESPWGPGRPGWHIECSAMSTCCLGDTFDIHGGGPDLRFPHHENEIAQSEAATGKTYVNVWMHAGAVRVDGEKMSKSLGNFFTIRDILDKYDAEVVRYLLIGSHYRSGIDYSEASLQEARGGLERFYTTLRHIGEVPTADAAAVRATEWYQRFAAAMDDDFNTREALAVMYELVRAINSAQEPAEARRLTAVLKALGGIFGLLERDPVAFLQGQGSSDDRGYTPARIEALIAERITAKAERNFARADAIRDELKAVSVVLEDSKAGTIWRRE